MEWMAKTRPAPGPTGCRRPLWFDRPLRPVRPAFNLPADGATSEGVNDRAPVWAIWLLIAFGALQPVAWMLADGLPASADARVVALLVVWVTLLALAAIATRRIRSAVGTPDAEGDGAPRDPQRDRTAADAERRCSTSWRDRRTCPSPSRRSRPGSRGSSPAIASVWRCCRTKRRSSRPTPRACRRPIAAATSAPDVVFKLEGTAHRSRRALARAADHRRCARARCLTTWTSNVLVTAGFVSVLIVPLDLEGSCGRHFESRLADDRSVRSGSRSTTLSRSPSSLPSRGLPSSCRSHSDASARWSHVGTDTVDRRRNQQRAPDHRRQLRPDRTPVSRRGPAADLAIVVRQSQRIAALLEKMRSATPQ